MFSFFVAKKGISGGVITRNVVERLERGSEAVVGLDDNSLLVGTKNGIFFGGVFDGGDVAFAIGNEEIFRDGARNALKGVEGLASSAAMFGDITNKMRR